MNSNEEIFQLEIKSKKFHQRGSFHQADLQIQYFVCRIEPQKNKVERKLLRTNFWSFITHESPTSESIVELVNSRFRLDLT